MLIPSPLVWEHAFIWLLPVFASCLSRRIEHWAVIACGVLFILLAVPLPMLGRDLGLVTLLPLWMLTGMLVVRAETAPLRVIAAFREQIISYITVR